MPSQDGGYDSTYQAGPPMQGSLSPDNRVAVADPTNPQNLIWVEARRDANGDLVPVDQRYSVLRGWDGQQATMGNPGGGSGVLVLLGIVALVAVPLLWNR